jgi:hypothetical protein
VKGDDSGLLCHRVLGVLLRSPTFNSLACKGSESRVEHSPVVLFGKRFVMSFQKYAVIKIAK